jgi:hypothetical protein
MDIRSADGASCETSMFMRVRRTVPHFTFVFSEGFVNRISSVSTGFFGFFAVLCGFRRFSGRFSSKSAVYWTRSKPVSG